MSELSNNIVVSSRVRLARNIEGYRFPHKMSESEGEEVLNMVFNACDNIGNFNNYKIRNIKNELLQENMEDNLITRNLIENQKITGVCISNDESVSIMVNEEEHLRLQCILPGLCVKKAYDIIDDIDTEISKHLKFSFSEELGYLTTCPTNVGTGIRVSALMFLPALTLTRNIQEVIATVSKLGISVRGNHGEGSLADGYLYQISNQATLGKTENDIVQLVESTVLKVCDLEMQARKQLMKFNEVGVRDDILRAFGTLTNCYTITSQESVELLSKVKLGIGLGIILLKEPQVIDDLLKNISAVKINKIANADLSDAARDIFRAQYLNRVLKNTRI